MSSSCEYQAIKMYVAESFLLRITIFLCMAIAVLTIIYFTPTPDQFYQSCDRPCHALDWPMICRVKLIIDLENRKSSQTCSSNSSLHPCNDSDLSLLSTISGKITVNDRFPGPAIQVCQNDVLVVDVVNRLEGNGISLHWRGQPQEEAPFMDGAPMITQCPITSYTTFQYKFRASNAGTHLWQAFAHSEVLQGIYGALIVRKADVLEEQRKYYDYDEKDHVILISTIDNKLLFNGEQFGAVFNVTRSKRYRFRTAYIASRNCLTNLTIQNHPLKVISLDGNAIVPYEVNTINLAEGERVDFVLKAKYLFSDYRIVLTSSCLDLKGAEAILRYNVDSKSEQSNSLNKGDGYESGRIFSTEFCTSKLGKVCLGDIHAMEKVPKELKEHDVDRQLYLAFDTKLVQIDKDKTDTVHVYRMNNITFVYPPSPLLTQYSDIPFNSICNTLRKPERCKNSDYCECIHVEEVILGSSIEIILIDQGGHAEENIFHMHGNSLYAIGSRKFNKPMSEQNIRELDSKKILFKRNLNSPVVKDTIRVPKFGVVALRFIADNPGFWMFRDELSPFWTRGMDIVFHVGSVRNLVATPTNFPTCGSWIGPKFFLL